MIQLHPTPATNLITSAAVLRSDANRLAGLPFPAERTGETETATEPARWSELDALGQYMFQASRWTRLEAADELRLGRAIKAGRNADGSLTPEANACFDLLVNSNLRLVYHAAAQLRQQRDEILELMSAGNVGLVEAAREYDADLGFRFSTYAFWNIRSRILRELNSSGRAVHLPRNIHEQLAKLRKIERELTQKLTREPTDSELSTGLGCTIEKLASLRAYQQHGLSLDAPVDHESELTLGQKLVDDAAETPAEIAARTSDNELVRFLLRGITEREAEVLRLRGGIDCEEHTLDEIGQKFGVSRERVRQIEEKALKKLRDQIRS